MDSQEIGIIKESIDIHRMQMKYILTAVNQLSSTLKQVAETQNQMVDWINTHILQDEKKCACALQERISLENRFMETVKKSKLN